MSGIDLIKKIREKRYYFQIKNHIDQCLIKNHILDKNISNSLRIDKIIEKSIQLEHLKDEVQKLLLTNK